MRNASKVRDRIDAEGPSGRFYFNHRAGACLGLDLEGVDLPSAEAALAYAYLRVLALSQSVPLRPVPHALEVTDTAGARLFEVPFSAVVTASTLAVIPL
jgi:hypothetical protein